MKRLAKFIVPLAFACSACIATAQVPLQPAVPSAAGAPTATAPNAAAHPLTAADLATFLDGLVPYMLKRGSIAGGVIVVVKDGKVLFARGYGHADLKTRAPVTPATTLFRIGSVSKLFTWTAVMQLVQQGKLDLDADINRYLDFRIPPKYGKPITLRDLMTMTPGFEDTTRDLLPATVAGVNLGQYLKAHVPARIFPPGKIVAYSNYGAGLAGYIVQRVSGEPFAAYVQQHILDPLDMQHSTFALDMANFMIAQLQDGRFGNTRILQRNTAKLMHSPQRTAAPGLNGYDLGFYQENRNGQRIIGHGGDTVVFHTDLHLLPDANVGIFMAFNSEGRHGAVNGVRTAISRDFLDRYFPYHAPSQAHSASARRDAGRVAGWYQSSRRNQSALHLFALLNQNHVVALPDGTLTVSNLTDYAGEPLHWREIGPLHYQQVHGQTLLDFVADSHGRIRYWATGENPTALYQRLPASMSMGAFGPRVAAAIAIVLATLLFWLIGWRVRRHYRQPLTLPRIQRRARLFSRLGALLLLIVIFGWLLLIACASANMLLLVRGTLIPWLYLLYTLGVLALLGMLAIAVNAACAWLAPRRSRWVCAGEILLACAAIYLAWSIVAFGLIGFSVRF